jgi:hypothetical protein
MRTTASASPIVFGSPSKRPRRSCDRGCPAGGRAPFASSQSEQRH